MNMRHFTEAIIEAREASKNLEFLREEDVKFITRCYDDVITEISDSFIEDRAANIDEIIRDYKSEGAEYYDMTEAEFNHIYDMIEKVRIFDACAYA